MALFGALRAGYTVVNCNPLYTPRELEHQLKVWARRRSSSSRTSPETTESVVAQTQVKTIVTTQIGDLLGFPRSALAQLRGGAGA